jgi:hypothetical protein
MSWASASAHRVSFNARRSRCCARLGPPRGCGRDASDGVALPFTKTCALYMSLRNAVQWTIRSGRARSRYAARPRPPDACARRARAERRDGGELRPSRASLARRSNGPELARGSPRGEPNTMPASVRSAFVSSGSSFGSAPAATATAPRPETPIAEDRDASGFPGTSAEGRALRAP